MATQEKIQIQYGGTDRANETEVSAGQQLLCGPDSQRQPTLSIVLPTLNEEAGIGTCIDRITAAITELGQPTEIIVSDSSTDRTPAIARERGAIVVEPDREGYGYAYQYAFERARGEYIVMGDADTTYDFGELPRLLELLVERDADIALGSRLDGEIKPGAMPALHRYVGNPLLTAFLNAFYDAGVSDAHSGFRVLTHEALQTLELRSEGMEFASEMIMDAGEKGLTIVETPITYHRREGEATLDSFRDGWRHVRFMLVNAPGYLFTGPAIVLVLVGLLSFVLSVSSLSIGPVYFGVHTALIGSLLVLTGYQIAGLAVFSAVATEPIRSPGDPLTDWVTDHFRLEHGAATGLCVCGLGLGYMGVAGLRWLSSGFSATPLLVPNVAAITIVIIGLQTVFLSFFLSTLATHNGGLD